MKSLQEAVEEFEKSEGRLAEDTPGALKDFKQYLRNESFSFSEQDMLYMVHVIAKRLRPNPKDMLNSHFAKIIITQHVLGPISRHLRDELLSLIDHSETEMRIDEIEEVAKNFVGKYSKKPTLEIQLLALKRHILNTKKSLARVMGEYSFPLTEEEKENVGNLIHYLNGSITTVVNGCLMSAIEDQIKYRHEEIRKAA